MGGALLKIARQRLLTHVGDNRARRVEAARLPAIPFFEQVLEHLAQHLRIDGDILFQRRVVGDREVVAVEEAEQAVHVVRVEDRVGDQDRSRRVARFVEQPAVQVGDADAFPEGDVAGAFGVHRLEEQRLQHLTVVVIGVAVVHLAGVALLRDAVAIRQEARSLTEPALALQEVEEHQPTEQPLREGVELVRVVEVADAGIRLLDRRFRALVVEAIVVVEMLRDRRHVEGCALRVVDLLSAAAVRVNRVERVEVVAGRLSDNDFELVDAHAALDRLASEARIDEQDFAVLAALNRRRHDQQSCAALKDIPRQRPQPRRPQIIDFVEEDGVVLQPRDDVCSLHVVAVNGAEFERVEIVALERIRCFDGITEAAKQLVNVFRSSQRAQMGSINGLDGHALPIVFDKR